MTEPDIFDWRPDGWEERPGLGLGLLVSSRFIQEEADLWSDAEWAVLLDEIRDAAEADSADRASIDPTVGAGSVGAAFWLQFAGIGADLIAWGGAALWLAPRIGASLRLLRERLKAEEDDIAVTGEVAGVFVLSDLAHRTGLNPLEITRLECLRHTAFPPEPREELRDLNCAYTVIVEYLDEEYLEVHTVTVSPFGRVLAEASVRVPRPNATQWTYPKDIRGGRTLEDLK